MRKLLKKINSIRIQLLFLLINIVLSYTAYAQTKGVLLSNIDVQIWSAQEVKILFQFSAKEFSNHTNQNEKNFSATDNLSKATNQVASLITNKNLFVSEFPILPLPTLNKTEDLLSVKFNNVFVNLKNNIIIVDHELLKTINVLQSDSQLELDFKIKPGIFYNIEQKDNTYILTLMTKDMLGGLIHGASQANNKNDLNNLKKSIDAIEQESSDAIQAMDQKKLSKVFKSTEQYSPKQILFVDTSTDKNEAVKKTEKSEKLNGYNSSDKGDLSEYSPPMTNKKIMDSLKKERMVSSERINSEMLDQTVLSSNTNKAVVKKVDFSLTDEKAAKIQVEFSNKEFLMSIDDNDNSQKKLQVIFKNIILPSNLNKTYDVGDFDTVVKQLAWKTEGNSAKLIITNTAMVDFVSYEVNNSLIIEIKSKADVKTDIFKLNKKYSGKKISLNFQSIELRAVLQLIADFTDLNLVASDTVQGNISLRLMNVPWDQALDIILKTKSLDKRYYGNILMIAPSTEIFELEKAELESDRLVERLINLETEYFHINYAKAEDLVTLLNNGTRGSVLSERGKVSFDKRTNILIVQDTPNKLKEINKVLKNLDTPVRQVLIEARLVRADTNFEKDLGVRWGLSAKRSSNNYNIGVGSNAVNASHTASTGAVVLPTNPTSTGTTGAIGTATSPINNGFNIDLGVTNPTTSLGLALAKLPGGTLVHLELSALEAEGIVETISTPKLITANKVPAKIEQGQEIPYQESTSSGAASIAFKKAVLSLTVTPQITPDNKIIMDLKVTNDSATTNPAAQNIPIINTQDIETQVLVDNSETIVLGGIFTQGVTNSVERIPFLGELPYVGQLFRRNLTKDNRSEFLIFITPKIIVEKV